MDPLSSVGLACNVIQLIDFGFKLIKQGGQIARAGQTDDHAHIKILAEDAQDLCKVLLGSPTSRNRLVPTLATRIADAEAQSGNQGQLNAAQYASVTQLAAKTQEVATDLSRLLQEVQINPATRASGFRATLKGRFGTAKHLVKAVHYDERIQSARRNLQELKQAIGLHLSLAQSQTSADVVTRFGEITKHERETRDKLFKLAHIKTDEIAEQCARSDDADMQSLGGNLSVLVSGLDDISLWMLALRSLAFEEMHNRAETIAETHASTYEWIFSHEELAFTQWLTNKDGCYWITGKPGSGKSTLMRYITRNKRTEELLATWAGSQRLVILDHYFWSPGTKIQKSVDGFLRTILHQLIRACPDLVTVVQPASWWLSTVSHNAWFGGRLRQAIKACGSAFSRLDIRVCLFVDGLDECEDEQHAELIELIWWLNRSSNIKACTASRPWNVFKSAYERSSDGTLTMHALTYDDIQKYVKDKLCEHHRFVSMQEADPTGCNAFIIAIIERAAGVFLWVRLVVRSFLKGLDNEDSLQKLTERLCGYPTSLDGYYERMLDRIEPIYNRHSARILLWTASELPALRAIDVVYLDMELAGLGYAERLRRHEDEKQSRQDQRTVTDRYLDARCADFLEIVSAKGEAYLHFFHRTAADFINKSDVQAKLYAIAGSSFNLPLSFAWSLLTTIKHAQPRCLSKETCRAIIELLAVVLLLPGTEQQQYRPLLESVIALKDGLETMMLDLDNSDILQDKGEILRLPFYDQRTGVTTCREAVIVNGDAPVRDMIRSSIQRMQLILSETQSDAAKIERFDSSIALRKHRSIEPIGQSGAWLPEIFIIEAD